MQHSHMTETPWPKGWGGWAGVSRYSVAQNPLSPQKKTIPLFLTPERGLSEASPKAMAPLPFPPPFSLLSLPTGRMMLARGPATGRSGGARRRASGPPDRRGRPEDGRSPNANKCFFLWLRR